MPIIGNVVIESQPPPQHALRPVKLRGMVLPGGGAPWPEPRAGHGGVRLVRELKAARVSPGARPAADADGDRDVDGPGAVGRIVQWPEADGRPPRAPGLRDRLRALLLRFSGRRPGT
jgi:hypothetical protein